MITQDELQTILDYNSETGNFIWNIKRPNVEINDVAGSLDKDGYVILSIKDKKYRAHRLAWFYVYGIWPKNDIDHKNRIRNDNRLDNLREATKSQNRYNTTKRKTNTSGYKGVCWSKNRNKWVVQYTFNNKNYHGGCFNKVEDAAKRYLELTKDLHGEFANIK